jgi:LuxR family transcriptional regulator, maltose regulon positive regulatory protein
MTAHSSKAKTSSAKPHNTQFMLERPRLLEPLAAAEDKKLIAILAPAGFGKTTLLKQHTARSHRKTAWLTLRDDAADAHTLARDTIYALRSVMPNLSFPQTNEALKIEARGNRLGVTLARDLNVINANLNIVFDRIEHLSTSSSSLIEALVEELGEGHQVLVAGYEGNPLPVSRFAVDGLALALSSSELNFTAEETVELLKARGFEGDAEQAHESMAGWSLGIAMIANGNALPTQPTELMKQLLERLPRGMMEWLPELAVLDVWSEEVAREVGCQVSHGWVNTVAKVGLPLAQISDGVYQPHSLLKESLENQLRKNAIRCEFLSHAAAKIAERNGKSLEAIKLYQMANLPDEAGRLIEKFAWESQHKGQMELASQVLSAIPEEKLSEKMFIFVNGRRLFTSEVHEAADKLLEMYRSGNRNPELLFYLAQASQRDGDAKSMDKYINEALQSEMTDSLFGKMMIAKSAVFYAQGNTKECKNSLEKALIKFTKSKDLGRIAVCNENLGIIHSQMGEYEEAKRHYQEADKNYTLVGNESGVIQNYNNWILLYCEIGDFERAKRIANGALVKAKELGDFWYSMILNAFTICNFYEGNLIECSEKIDEVIKKFENSMHNNLKNVAVFLKIQVTVILGKKESIDLEVKDFLEKMESSGEKNTTYYFLKGFQSYIDEDMKAAKESFSQAREKATDKRDKARILLYLAEIERRMGKSWKALVDEFFSVLDQIGYDNLIKIDRPLVKGLYGECIRRNLYRERILKCINEKSLKSESKGLTLNVKTFDDMLFTLEDKKIKLSLHKSKELLIWLAIQGAASRSEIIKALWGKESPQSREYFKIAMRKLRTALLESPAIYVDPAPFKNDLYQLDPCIEVQWDFKAFQQKLHSNEYSMADLKSVANFSSNFLIGFTSEWIQNFKQGVLDSIYSTLLEVAGTSNASRAIELLETAIALDPLSQEAYKKLAMVLKQSGRADEAARVQQRFIAALES